MIQKFDNIIAIEGTLFDSNIYILGDTVVDTGTGMNPDNLMRRIREAGVEPGSIKHIVNTHCHFDHTGGNRLFNADIAIHSLDAEALREGNDEKTVAYMFSASMEPMEVAVELGDGDFIGDFEVIHTPGHTPGCICLYDGRSLISGDTVFADGGFGRVDVGGDINELAESIKKLMKLDIEYLFPGHGPWVDNGSMHVELAAAFLGIG
ncbi:MBL fold metallo-hydrolase [Methanothermobacter marburgensis]|uniref:Predicted Zn-dependent hydrolase n=1 Tax=Methanothermobacter marburgensis (strain ATCC BAA-927 / DSM 2133 / JCM 14651 / NBRC 100331 / OCM 82 / Marburg) TaxID=79929 RepID=D9PYD5_METTM|nr:MBL fold metallo-hydrolase [Methanothermobacter marburgensis]ADL59233.1 predicted Zn-dependent hydrolase [Methanothermobacter marburgensis str. Marburg]WBF09736.1 MBL fold metallo-hydrolase [Methanothermobacter marburgensis]